MSETALTKKIKKACHGLGKGGKRFVKSTKRILESICTQKTELLWEGDEEIKILRYS